MADCFINGHMYGPKQTCMFCGADSGTSQPLMELREIALRALNDPIDPQTPMYERDLVVQAEVLLKLIDHYIETTRQPHPDTVRLDKLPACFHMLRYRHPPGAIQGWWWLTYAPNHEYSDVRMAIDAHVEPTESQPARSAHPRGLLYYKDDGTPVLECPTRCSQYPNCNCGPL